MDSILEILCSKTSWGGSISFAIVCSVNSTAVCLLVENRPHTIGDMLLVCPVDGHTFFAIPMVAAGLLARTMVFVFVFSRNSAANSSCNFKPSCRVALVKFSHSVQFFLFPSIFILSSPFANINRRPKIKLVSEPQDGCPLKRGALFWKGHSAS